MGQNPDRTPVNIPIQPLKSRLKWVVNSPTPKWDPKTVWTHSHLSHPASRAARGTRPGAAPQRRRGAAAADFGGGAGGAARRHFAQGSLKETFCSHLKHVAFSTPKQRETHVQVAMFRQCIRIPVSGDGTNGGSSMLETEKAERTDSYGAVPKLHLPEYTRGFDSRPQVPQTCRPRVAARILSAGFEVLCLVCLEVWCLLE